MAQDRILGEQLDIVDVSDDIANNPAAIDNIATGVANDPTAAASLEAGIDHDNIINVGTNTHAQIDSHISDGTLHFTQASITITASQVSDFNTATTSALSGSSIDDLGDVSAGSPITTGYVLTYSNSPAGWIAAPTGGGDVTNPMTSNLDLGGFDLLTASAVTASAGDINVITGSSNVSGYKAGDILILSGSGTYVGDDSTAAGKITIRGGTRTYTGYGTTDYGNVTAGYNLDHTSIEILGGDGAYYSGAVLIKGGTNNKPIGGYAGYAGYVLITGGTANYTGGDVNIEGGIGYNGGGVNISGANAVTVGSPPTNTYSGAVYISGGRAGAADGGSDVDITGGYSTNSPYGPGAVRIKGGGVATSSTVPTAGNAFIDGGSSQTNGTTAGSVHISGGSNFKNGNAGSVLLIPGNVTGSGSPAGVPGIVIVEPSTQATEATIYLRSLTGASDKLGLTVAPLTTDITLTFPADVGINGQALQSDGSGIMTFAGPPLFRGTGTPETVVAAPQGALYTDAGGGSGTTLYIKESGTSNIGWIAVAAAGAGAPNWINANNGVNFTTPPITSGGVVSPNIAIGDGASATSTYEGSIAIGNFTTVNAYRSIAIGENISMPSGTNSVSIGYNTTSLGSRAVTIGNESTSDAHGQVTIGAFVTSASVTNDVIGSVKLGYNPIATAENKNVLHLFNKGKLELYGDEAQFIMPNYTIGSPLTYPANSVEGGVIYDSVTKELQVYGGSPAGWSAVGGDVIGDAVSYGTTGAISLDTSTGTYFYPTGTTTGVITFSFTNPSTTGSVTSFTLELLGAGTNAPVWPATVKWPGGAEPSWTATTTPDIVRFVTRDNGTTWLGILDGLAFA